MTEKRIVYILKVYRTPGAGIKTCCRGFFIFKWAKALLVEKVAVEALLSLFHHEVDDMIFAVFQLRMGTEFQTVSDF